MKVEKEKNGENRIILPEILSVEEVDDFRKEMNSLIEQGQKNFLLDFGRCEFIDSTGLGVIISVYKRCVEKNGNIKIGFVKPRVMDLFKLTRLDRVFEFIS